MNLMPIYSVPLWQSEFPDFNDSKENFIEVVKKYISENDSINLDNVGGYRSPDTLHHEEELRPLFQYICDYALNALSDLDFVDCDVALTAAWVNVNDSRQCYNTEHVHNEVLSGVFFLSTPDQSGKLSISNPAINRIWKGIPLVSQKNQYTAESIKIEPIEGNIILFPSYVPNAVEQNDHDEERISISFNIIALPKGSMDFGMPPEE